MGISGADILWDEWGANNDFDESNTTVFPSALPSSFWPDFIYRIDWNPLKFLIGLL